MSFLSDYSDKKILLLFVLPVSIIYGFLLSQFKQLPSAIYGGDLYYHFGMFNHYFHGGDILSDPIFNQELVFYSLFPYFLAKVSNLFNLSALSIYKFLPVIEILTASVASFLLSKQLFAKNKLLRIIFTISWVGVFHSFFFTHPRIFAVSTLFPLLVWSFLKFRDKRNLTNQLIFAGCYSLLGLTHLFGFIAASIFLFLFYLYSFLQSENKTLFIKRESKNLILPAIVTVIATFPLLGVITFYYDINTLNPATSYSTPVPDLMYATKHLFFLIFNRGTLFNLIYFPLVIIGFYYVFISEKIKQEVRTAILALLLAFFIGSFHFIVTQPLFDFYWVYWQFPFYFTYLISLIFICYGILFLQKKLTYRKSLYFVLLFSIFFAVVININFSYKGFHTFLLGKNLGGYNESWLSLARNEKVLHRKRANWIKKNTNINDVFLSNNELSFAINALTGRKIITTRRTHANPFVNINERQADAGIMLYGTNESQVERLLDKYEVEYLYFHSDWQEVSKLDPLLVPSTYKDYLDKGGVEFKQVKSKLDPGKRGVPKYKRLKIVVPDKIFRNKPIMNFFEPIYKQNGIVIYKRIK